MGILDVSKRMATLEKAIHTSLAELVLIAGTAVAQLPESAKKRDCWERQLPCFFYALFLSNPRIIWDWQREKPCLFQKARV